MEKANEHVYMLTTLDNPFDPFDNFSEWFMFDVEKEHFTSARLARLVEITPEMTQKEIDDERNRAMDFIIMHDLEDKFIKVREKQNATVTNA
jgi:hypothetical protein